MSEVEIKTTPKGLAKHAWLLHPDTKFNPDGTYQTNIVLKKEDAKAICKQLKKEYNDAQKPKKKAGKMPYFENDDGDIEIKFSQKSIIKTKSGDTFKKTVALLDSKRKPIKVNVGNGSTIRVSFKTRPYDYNGCGISLDLIAVQVLDLVEWEEREQEYGFEDEDGGFEGTDESPEEQENGFVDVLLKKQGSLSDWKYEDDNLDYTIRHKYVTDFKLIGKHGRVMYIETKGYFKPKDRTKHVQVRKEHPDADLRFIFMNSRTKISKKSKTTYGSWCTKKGFQYADKRIPLEWIIELNKE
jgi:hypothetical protein